MDKAFGGTMKTCGRCRQAKSLAEFTPSARLRSGTWCNPCMAVSNKARWHHLKQNADYTASRRADLRRNYQMRKLDAIRLLGSACRCCDETRPQFLQIDHINNDGAEHRRALGTGGGSHVVLYSQIREGKTSGLQLLCANCNWGKARNGGICPHEEERMAIALLSA